MENILIRFVFFKIAIRPKYGEKIHHSKLRNPEKWKVIRVFQMRKKVKAYLFHGDGIKKERWIRRENCRSRLWEGGRVLELRTTGRVYPHPDAGDESCHWASWGRRHEFDSGMHPGPTDGYWRLAGAHLIWRLGYTCVLKFHESQPAV